MTNLPEVTELVNGMAGNQTHDSILFLLSKVTLNTDCISQLPLQLGVTM